MTRGATLFSGGGGAEALLKDSVQFVHAVEYDPAIAAVYRQNHGDHIQVADVCDVDYSTWGALDYLHASPVCKNASQAKTDGEESDTDIKTALAVVRCLEETQPRVFTLENVGGYRKFKAYRLICRALDLMGYMWHAEVLNSADFGVPQTRRRLILRAVRDSLLPGWPAPLPWVGWYAAIEDILHTLPPSQFAPWQLERLPEEITDHLFFNNQTGYSDSNGLVTTVGACPAPTVVSTHKTTSAYRAFIVGNNDSEWGAPYRTADQPMLGMTTQTGSRTRAWLVNNHYGDPDGDIVNARHDREPAHMVAPINPMRAYLVGDQAASHGTGVQLAGEGEPAFTLTTRASGGTHPRAFIVDQQNGSRDSTVRHDDQPIFTLTQYSTKHPTPRAWLSQGRVVKMTPRALARFQSLPDSFILPEKASLACTVIGNAVPSLLMREIVKPLL